MCRDYDLRDNPNGRVYSLLQAAYMEMNKGKTSGIKEAERFFRSLQIFCMATFLENFEDADVRDRFLSLLEKVNFPN